MSKQQAYKIAMDALESKRSVPFSDLLKSSGSIQKSTCSEPDGQTYFLDIAIDQLTKDGGVRVTATVDLASSFKLERVEEHIDIFED